MLLSFSGLILINAYGAVGSKCATYHLNIECPSTSNEYSYAMIGLGIVCSLASLTFTLVMHCMMRGYFGSSTGQVNTYQNHNEDSINSSMGIPMANYRTTNSYN